MAWTLSALGVDNGGATTRSAGAISVAPARPVGLYGAPLHRRRFNAALEGLYKSATSSCIDLNHADGSGRDNRATDVVIFGPVTGRVGEGGHR